MRFHQAGLSQVAGESFGEKESMYGLQHERLHLRVATPMLMNMGHWGHVSPPDTLADACKDLLKMVLREAGLSNETERAGITKATKRPKLLIDLGSGRGDQTVYLMSQAPVRIYNQEWWDEREYCSDFDHYIGVAKDATQHRYASERINGMVRR